MTHPADESCSGNRLDHSLTHPRSLWWSAGHGQSAGVADTPLVISWTTSVFAFVFVYLCIYYLSSHLLSDLTSGQIMLLSINRDAEKPIIQFSQSQAGCIWSTVNFGKPQFFYLIKERIKEILALNRLPPPSPCVHLGHNMSLFAENRVITIKSGSLERRPPLIYEIALKDDR